MGILDSLFGSNSNKSSNASFDEVMNSMDDQDVDALHGPADYYVKPISLQTDSDLTVVDSELKAGNVVLLNISPIARNPTKLKDSISSLTTMAKTLDGDIARISEDKVLLTPKRMKIVKSVSKTRG